MRPWSIKDRVSLAVALLFVVALVAAGMVQRRLVQGDIIRLVTEQQASLVERVGRDIDSKFETGAGALSATASHLDERDLADPRELRRQLAAHPALLSLFDDILVLDARGIVIADSPEVVGRTGVDASDRAFFKEVFRSGKTVVSEPALGRTRREPIVQLAAPIRASDGQIAGVLLGVIRLYRSTFLGRLGDERIGKTGYFSILTRGPKPLFVVHPQRSRILQERPANGARAVTDAIAGFEGTRQDISSAGVPTLYTTRLLHAVPWVLVAAVPVDEVFAPIQAALRRFWIIVGAATAVLVPLVWLVVRQLLRPLQLLRGSIAGLREGEGEFVPIPVTRPDEVGEITRQFNELMRQRLGAEKAQRESEARLRLIADNVPALISYVDAELRFRFANSAYREWLGLDPEAMVGRRVDDVFDDANYRATVLPHLQRALAGEATTYEWEILAREGPRTVRTSSFPSKGPSGEVVGIYNLTTDITRDRELQVELDRLARRDSLTGLHNRRSFMEILPQALARAALQQRWLALLFVDLDHFKAVNDDYGHEAGDEVLHAVAERLEGCVRATDTVARLGGDEFTVIVEGLDTPEEAEVIAAKIVAAIGQPIGRGRRTYRVSASVGVAACRGGPIDPDELLKRADSAAYAAKNAGRGRYERAEPLAAATP